ncbi:MAG TPA: hypothetical protein VGR45_07195 [Stellaceae bacterium]|nr:hypothetical protein [Stellaceae bacterium]
MSKVEIDDEVLALVNRNAESLIGSLTAVLHILQATIAQRRPEAETDSPTGSGSYEVPFGTPQALRQILEIVWLVRRAGRTRREATREVAVKLGVAPQTVIDKYTRQLALTAPQFDRLLAAERSDELQMRLRSKFPEYGEVIDHAFARPTHEEHPLDIADRLFGPEHGAELPIPCRGSGPDRSPPDFTRYEQGR